MSSPSQECVYLHKIIRFQYEIILTPHYSFNISDNIVNQYLFEEIDYNCLRRVYYFNSLIVLYFHAM